MLNLSELDEIEARLRAWIDAAPPLQVRREDYQDDLSYALANDARENPTLRAHDLVNVAMKSIRGLYDAR